MDLLAEHAHLLRQNRFDKTDRNDLSMLVQLPHGTAGAVMPPSTRRRCMSVPYDEAVECLHDVVAARRTPEELGVDPSDFSEVLARLCWVIFRRSPLLTEVREQYVRDMRRFRKAHLELTFDGTGGALDVEAALFSPVPRIEVLH